MQSSISIPLLVIVCAILGCTEEKPRVRPVAETSASFDMADIGPFLERLSEVTFRAFDRRRAGELTRWIREQGVGSEEEYIYAVDVDGRKTDMRVVAVIDDVDAVDLYIHTHPELIRRIDLLMDEFFEDVGK
jgi:hypothetical protein